MGQSQKEARPQNADRDHCPWRCLIENTFHESSVTISSPAPKRMVCPISLVVTDRPSVLSAMSKTVRTAKSPSWQRGKGPTSPSCCPGKSDFMERSFSAAPHPHTLPSSQPAPPDRRKPPLIPPNRMPARDTSDESFSILKMSWLHLCPVPIHSAPLECKVSHGMPTLSSTRRKTQPEHGCFRHRR